MDYTRFVGGGVQTFRSRHDGNIRTLDFGPNNESPNQSDYNTLSKNYGHIDGVFNVDRWVVNLIPVSVPCWTPGKVAYSSSNGNIKRYESDYGRGLKMITYATMFPKKR